MGAEPVAAKHLKAQRAKAKMKRATVQADGGRMTKHDLVAQALAHAGPDSGTADVWPHLFAVLDQQGMVPREAGAKDTRQIHATDANGRPVVFTFKGVQTMLRQLRQAPAARRGRPKKKPA